MFKVLRFYLVYGKTKTLEEFQLTEAQLSAIILEASTAIYRAFIANRSKIGQTSLDFDLFPLGTEAAINWGRAALRAKNQDYRLLTVTDDHRIIKVRIA
jgi:hypothetical protein